jgi:hypothetical protein
MPLHPWSLSLAYAKLQEHGYAAGTIRHACEMAAERGSYTIGRATITFDRENGYRVTTARNPFLDGQESAATDAHTAEMARQNRDASTSELISWYQDVLGQYDRTVMHDDDGATQRLAEVSSTLIGYARLLIGRLLPAENAATDARTADDVDHRSADNYPVTVGAKFWNNNLRVVQITAIGTQDTREYADTGEYATWHKHTGGSSDTLTGHMQKYGRLTRHYVGKDAENYPNGTDYSDIK